MRTQDFAMEGVYRGESGIFQEMPSQRVWGTEVPSGVRGQNSSRGLGNEVPQKPKQKCEIIYNF